VTIPAAHTPQRAHHPQAANTATILVTSAYIAAQMLSDIGSLKIVSALGFVVDAGTLIYPLTFTLRDLVHKVVGRRRSRLLILVAAVINLIMAGYFWLIARLPYAAEAGPQPDFNAVLAPVWRIVVASILAEIVAELADTEIYHLWVTRFTRSYQWARVLVSNSVSVPLDSLIFVFAAFWGVFPLTALFSILWANVLAKYLTTLLSLPLIYAVPSDTPGEHD
jgi:queuosine precursor transporter